jgi:hypothetical protein
MILAIPVLAAIGVNADFEGGSIGPCRSVAENHIECALEGETDQDGRNRQATWYYFRLDAPAARELSIDFVELSGEYNYRPTAGLNAETPPVFSYDRKAWRHPTTIEYESKTPRVRIRFTAERSPVWIAHVPPYTGEDLGRLLAEVGSHPHLKREVIGKTVGGREILLLTITDPAVPANAKKVLWLMVRQHAWESGTSWVGEGALRFLLSSDPEAIALRRRTIFRMFPNCDPDGVARGGVRFNANGFDLNRNWDAVDPIRMPEITAQRKAVLDWVDAGRPLHLFLALHNTETGEYLEGPPTDKHADLMERFFRVLRETTVFSPTRDARPASPTTTTGLKGRMTVNQGLFHDRGIPAFLMEQMIAKNPRLERFPTVADRLRFGRDLARAMALAIE